MLILFSFTLFLSAFLLFGVQLMVAKMILPLLGGSPSVWNTCQFFFQATLLLGYAYSHLSTQGLGTRRQAAIHGMLLLLPIAGLPIAISTQWIPPQAANPIPWLLALLVASVGLPFFVVSTSAPLLQKWFAETEHPHSNDPYFLYSASNFGSLLGLLSYPFIIEPNFSLTQQSRLWAIAYFSLIVLTLICAFYLWKSKIKSPTNPLKTTLTAPSYFNKTSSSNNPPPLPGEGGRGERSQLPEKPTLAQQAQWIFLSFIPASLLLGVTTYLTTDLASIPLLWAIPLSLYLLSFILTFSRKAILPHQKLVTLLPLFSSPLIILFLAKVMRPIALLVPLHLLGFLAIACVFHGELARRRPSPEYLTGFYLWISVGGVLGGWFNAIAAPILFPSVLEYPIVLLLAILILQEPLVKTNTTSIPNFSNASATDVDRILNEIRLQKQQSPTPPHSIFKFNLQTTRLLSLGLLCGALIVGFHIKNITNDWWGTIFAIALFIAIYFAFQLPRRRLIVGIVLILLLGKFSIGNLTHVLATDRNFFGVNRVIYDRRGPYHSLLHGTTLHGRQSLDPQRRNEPLTYFHPTGPIGQVFDNFTDRSRIAVLGLGIGTLAAYAEPGQTWTFYEIDPTVEKIARDPRYFTFLQDAKTPVSVILGDARLQLVKAPDKSYDMLVMDAFSSDSIPVHLVTKEALQLYWKKLSDRGILVINISNRFINLEPVLGALARDLGLSTRRQLELEISPQEKALGKTPSHWVLLARNPEDFGTLATDSRWQPIPETADMPLWTDDFSDLWHVLRLFDSKSS